MVQGIVKLLSLFESSGKKKKKESKENCKIAFALLSHASNNDAVVYRLLTLPKVKILFRGFNNKIYRLSNYL